MGLVSTDMACSMTGTLLELLGKLLLIELALGLHQHYMGTSNSSHLSSLALLPIMFRLCVYRTNLVAFKQTWLPWFSWTMSIIHDKSSEFTGIPFAHLLHALNIKTVVATTITQSPTIFTANCSCSVVNTHACSLTSYIPQFNVASGWCSCHCNTWLLLYGFYYSVSHMWRSFVMYPVWSNDTLWLWKGGYRSRQGDVWSFHKRLQNNNEFKRIGNVHGIYDWHHNTTDRHKNKELKSD